MVSDCAEQAVAKYKKKRGKSRFMRSFYQTNIWVCAYFLFGGVKGYGKFVLVPGDADSYGKKPNL